MISDVDVDVDVDADKGLFINDVIIFGGQPDPPPFPLVIMSYFGYPPHYGLTGRLMKNEK